MARNQCAPNPKPQRKGMPRHQEHRWQTMPTAGAALLGLSSALGQRGEAGGLGEGFLNSLPPFFQYSGCPRSNARLRCGQGLSLRLTLKRST
ncbi:MAG: hypothetical protein M2R46_03303 [Verrucomicrobia subdivision 3 bacterium]|nr:hypothetical protein [Limisphaerales bacterium]